MALLESPSPENLNEAKTFFESLPHDTDNDHVDMELMQAAMDSNQLTTSTCSLIKKHTDHSSEGKISFSEIATLVRGGKLGILPATEAQTLIRLMTSVKPTSGLHQLTKDVPEEDMLQALHESFLEQDATHGGVLPWTAMDPLGRAYLRKLDGVVENTSTSDLVFDALHSESERKMDFQDW